MLKIIGGLFILIFVIIAVAEIWWNYTDIHDQDWWR